MAKIVLDITEEHIRLIRNINYKRFTEDIVGIDDYDLYGGTHKYEQMAYILGCADKAIEGEETIYGPKYPDDVMEHLRELDAFMVEHLLDIEEILHQFCDVGISPGRYEAKDYQRLWKKTTSTK